MSTFSHTDWTVICDYSDAVGHCPAQERTDTLALRDGTATAVRKVLKRRGWAVAVFTGREKTADFCPDHKPPPPVRVRGYGGYRLPPGRRGSTT